MAGKFYLTTTLPYVNADPHIGFALEIVQADAIARYRRLLGDEVVFNTGTDEHGIKIYRKALEEGKDPQAYVDEYAVRFGRLKDALALSYTNFIRTTDPAHKAAAEEFWKRCAATGDIYKKIYAVKYCVGCELEKTDSELEDGRCPIHPNLELERLEEENYFFAFSKYGPKLLELYAAYPDFVVPDFRFNEIKAFVERGLADFSVSRLKSKMPWGVPVPGDAEQVMYVWFDALVNYISTLGWPNSVPAFAKAGDVHGKISEGAMEEREGDVSREGLPEWEEFWPGLQLAGKDNLRQQSAMWQAMLMSAGLPATRQIFIHGFITSGGQKMSKSLGNVVDPFALVEEYGTDAVRFYLLREIHPFEDSDFTETKFREAYNASLANGIGNLASRVMKMAVTHDVRPELPSEAEVIGRTLAKEVSAYVARYEINRAMDRIWGEIGSLDRRIAETKPFSLVKTDEAAAKKIIAELVLGLAEVAVVLRPFLPGAAAKIAASITSHQLPPMLFPRKT